MANQFTQHELKNFNKALEEKITAAVGDQSKWKDVLPELMGAEVFVVAQLSQEDEKGNRLLNLLTMTNKDGQTAVPFFTSPQRMSVLATPQRKQINCMKMNTVKLFQAIKGKIALLNPGSPDCARMFSPFETNLLVMENLDKLPKAEAPAPAAEAKTEE